MTIGKSSRNTQNGHQTRANMKKSGAKEIHTSAARAKDVRNPLPVKRPSTFSQTSTPKILGFAPNQPTGQGKSPTITNLGARTGQGNPPTIGGFTHTRQAPTIGGFKQ